MSQKSGIGDRSVVICVVMPSIKLDGMAASMTQRRRRPNVISSEAMRTDGSVPSCLPAPGLPCLPPGCPALTEVADPVADGAVAVMPVCDADGAGCGVAGTGAGSGFVSGFR